MPIYDNNGSASYEIGSLFDNNGTTSSQIGKVYDNNGTSSALIYEGETQLFPPGQLTSWSAYAYNENGTWSSGTYTPSSTAQGLQARNGNVVAGAYISTSNIRLYAGINAIGYNGSRLLSNTAINLTGVNTITLTAYSSTSDMSKTNAYAYLSATKPTYSGTPHQTAPTGAAVSVALPAKTSSSTVTMNVSNLSGNYYLAFWLYVDSNDSAISKNYYVTKIVAS